MDKPFNYVDPFSQEAVMDKLEDYYDNPSDYIDMSIDADLLTDNQSYINPEELPF